MNRKQGLNILLCTGLLLCMGVSAFASADFTNDMKMTGPAKLTVAEGAASIERQYDHQDSPYYAHPDIYHMKSTSTLTLLSGYKTFQQTSEWSCGPAAALTVLSWYHRADGWNEQKLADLRHPLTHVNVPGFPDGYPGTTLRQMEDIFDGVGGFHYISSADYQKEGKTLSAADVRQFLKEGHPILVCWIDWSGHWQAIIGYDDMGTANEADDVILMADPYDTTDHNQDGYGIYSWQRFQSMFSMYGQFPESEGGNNALFLVPVPDKE
ncbi:MAG: papain-like cysteine protease family protein [Allisonella histaminiformans]|uniref:C39 family peptidase n=1 Tax=Allisonella histaminiformans TaxID=209880 RepID=UPI002A81057B|nr:papain-like cysteine protease family protein [Allisonella histaminiformans]MDY4540176.1 papain-like cysteine protease family protein [Allisonella histaminiformans]